MKSLITLTIFVLLTALITGCATSSSIRKMGHSSGQNTTWEATGKVSRFLATPEGEVDGLIFEDGMQVRFPAHMSTAITNDVARGDTVTVKGFESSANVIRAEKIVTAKNAHEIRIEDQAQGKLLAPRKSRDLARQNLQNMKVTGEIDALIYEPTGEVSGFLLTEGSIVRLPVDIREPLRSYDVGQFVEVTGYGSQSKYGKALEASTVQRAQSEIDYE